PDGSSEGAFVLPSGIVPQALAIADLDGDGRPDLLVRHLAGIEILRNTTARSCATAFEEQARIPVGNMPRAVAAVDVNGDGRLDLVVACAAQLSLSILLGNGDGTFQAATSIPATSLPYTEWLYEMSIAAGDLDRDGKVDLVVTNTDTDTGVE